MDPNTLKILQGAAGAAGDSAIGVEDVFKTYVYKGTGSSLSINNSIDLAGDGGMVWTKQRDNVMASYHYLADTERGITNFLIPSESSSSTNNSNRFASVSSTGFTIGTEADINTTDKQYVSWTFKKQEKFFDVVTFTTSNPTIANRRISHNLGCAPGLILLKNLSSNEDWLVFHRTQGINEYGRLNDSVAWTTLTGVFGTSNPTATDFGFGENVWTTASQNFVAYLFAHEEAEFGPNSDQKIISCGSYTGTGSAGLSVTLPFEPSFLIVKNATSSSQDWIMWDSIRGIVTGQNDPIIRANLNNAEATDTDHMSLTPTGFKVTSTNDGVNKSGDTYIYIAIAAETGKTMKAIETGTDVFAMDTGGGTSTIPNFDANFAVDFAINRAPASSDSWETSARLIEGKYLTINTTDTEAGMSNGTWDSNAGWNSNSNKGSSKQSWMWKRHAGFDVVTYKATGVAGLQINHNLGVVPEMIWCKRRDGSDRDWMVYHKGLNGGTNPEQYHLVLNTSSAEVDSANRWNDTAPTASVVTLGSSQVTNDTGTSNFIMMLFASISGISAVGSYTGVSGQLQIRNLGFTPRFLLVKRRDGTGKWVVFDTTRGWGSGDDKKIFLTDLAQTNQDVGDPVSSGGGGFDFYSGNDDFNNTGKEYIYYAHA